MRHLGSWGTALVASVALHIVVLGLLLGFRGCGGAETPPPAPPPQTDGRATDLPEAKDAEPTVEPKPAVSKPEPKKPVRDDKKRAEDVSDGWRSYKVQSGDSLTRIARRCGITVQELAKANRISPLANLRLGQTLKIKDVPADDTDEKANP